MLLSIFDDTQDERRHDDDRVRADTPDRVPLQFGDTVPDTNDTRAQLAYAEEVCQSGHKSLVDGCHQLEDVARLGTGTLKGDLLVVSQSLEVGIRHGKRHRVAKRPRRGDVVDDLMLRHADKVFVIRLKVGFFGKWNRS